MEVLLIKEENEKPKIKFDGDNGILTITGKSYPEDVTNFYKPLFDYISLYKANPNKKTIIEFNWLYYNTATSKVIVKIIMMLKDISPVLEVKWFCKQDMDLMIEKGKELKDILEINLEIVII